MAEALRIGTRGSALALRQAEQMQELLSRVFVRPCTLVRIQTTGDRLRDAPLSEIGGKGVFVKEIEAALLAGEIDVAVHSAKDLPSRETPGTVLAAFPEREDPRDVLAVRSGLEDVNLFGLPAGARVGTSSLRRRCQILARRPDLTIDDLRGNVDTRLRKLHEGRYDAIVLARAGLLRLAREREATCLLPIEVLLPAVAQGILAVQTREEALADEVRRAIDDPAVRLVATAERSFLARLEGGCQIPVAAHAYWTEGASTDRAALELRARVVSLDGRECIEGSRRALVDAPGGRPRADTAGLAAASDLGSAVAEEILRGGAERILAPFYRGAGNSGSADLQAPAQPTSREGSE